eukprot:7434688-Pyramimonas_sp.AAC.1
MDVRAMASGGPRRHHRIRLESPTRAHPRRGPGGGGIGSCWCPQCSGCPTFLPVSQSRFRRLHWLWLRRGV